MTAEWISVGLLALLVLFFVLDIAGNRKRAPRPKPVPQRKREVARGPAPVPAEPEAETEVPPEPAVEAAEPEAAQPAVEPAPAPEPVPAAEPEVEREPETRVSVFERIKQGLGKTRASLTGGLADLFSVGKKIDEDLLEEIETTLLMADVGVTATSEIIDALTEKLERNQLKDGEALRKALRDELHGLLKEVARPLEIDAGKQPYVILMVGVNGVGKTTTIGKLTKKFQSEGKSVMLAAGDTFRAAAVEQLQVWGERNNVPVVAQHTGADSASVIFDAIQSAQSRGVDVVIADTAGRLQNKDNLMNELSKVVRVMKKLDESAPHEVMLVLDAGTGQNALSQAQVFQQAVGVSGITLTKLDGTAKGGIVFAIARQLQLPIRYIGVGEQAEDLRSFDAETFVDALFED
ncbi:signal recognition particle-docking protein FtsY [Marinobacter nauticus]|uniref:Signal recognition particle receptor FtsY n=1 Tax=Marinobacter nauticus (strain ATCC 700491 / DSM 11845 / VT8) TaxID=351348 RepID=A1U746_MARN8|nr:signal recognition particle-docking protein FtsY [Marinobacter nauticus]ABM20815.1 signal recognition particle-docking protein FtsY [Marinobacter nauticus VT8]